MADRLLPCPMGTCHRCDTERRAEQDAQCLGAREAWKVIEARKQPHGPRPSRLEWFHVWLTFCLVGSVAFTVNFVRIHDALYTLMSGVFTLFIAAFLGSSLTISFREPK